MLSEVFAFWARETASNIRRNRLMSLLAVSTVTIGLFVLGAFYLAWGSMQSKVNEQTKKLDLAVILNRDVNPARRKQIYEAARIPQVSDLQFVSKDKVLQQLAQGVKDMPIADLKKENPLGDELHLKLKNPNDFFKVRNYMLSIKGVKDIRRGDFGASLDENAVRNLLAINKFVKIAGLVALIILGLGILMIIHNAIRLTIFARRREIRIMELVGATSAFIRVPFLLEGIVYGLTGAVYAAIALVVIFVAINRSNATVIQLLLPEAPVSLMVRCLLWIAVTGVFFGLAGSWLSLSRSLDKSASI